MNNEIRKISRFIFNEVFIEPNITLHVYRGPAGFVTTRDSWEYRDDDHKNVISLCIGDDVPGSVEEIEDIIQFLINQEEQKLKSGEVNYDKG